MELTTAALVGLVIIPIVILVAAGAIYAVLVTFMGFWAYYRYAKVDKNEALLEEFRALREEHQKRRELRKTSAL